METWHITHLALFPEQSIILPSERVETQIHLVEHPHSGHCFLLLAVKMAVPKQHQAQKDMDMGQEMEVAAARTQPVRRISFSMEGWAALSEKHQLMAPTQ